MVDIADQQLLSAIASLEIWRNVLEAELSPEVAERLGRLTSLGLVDAKRRADGVCRLVLTKDGASAMLEGAPWEVEDFLPSAPGPLADAWLCRTVLGMDVRVLDGYERSPTLVARLSGNEDLLAFRTLFRGGASNAPGTFRPSQMTLGSHEMEALLDDLDGCGLEVSFHRSGGAWRCAVARDWSHVGATSAWEAELAPLFQGNGWHGALVVRAAAGLCWGD